MKRFLVNLIRSVVQTIDVEIQADSYDAAASSALDAADRLEQWKTRDIVQEPAVMTISDMEA